MPCMIDVEVDRIRVFGSFKFGLKTVTLRQAAIRRITYWVRTKARCGIIKGDAHWKSVECVLCGAVETH